MDYKKWTLASNITTMTVGIVGLLAAVTYYFFIVTNLEFKYYLILYVILFSIIGFIFFQFGLNLKEEQDDKEKKSNVKSSYILDCFSCVNTDIPLLFICSRKINY